MVDEEGLEAAAKECEIMDVVQELHSLGAELKKSHLTAEDAKVGHKAAVVFEQCGVPPDGYKDVVVTCLKMHDEGFLPAAMELHKIEESSGLSCKEIVAHAATCQTQLQQWKKELSATQEKVGQTKQTLAAIQQQQAGAEKELQQKLHKAGLDYMRLEKVENLAIALKKAGVTDEELDSYLQRQNLFNKANIPIAMFVQILNAAKVPTAADGGKNLFKKLTEYGSLDGTIVALKQEKQSLANEVKDLNEKAKLKGAIQTDITHLQSQKNELEGSVATIYARYDHMFKLVKNLEADYKSRSDELKTLNITIPQKQAEVQTLTQEVESKQQKVADLTLLETKRDAIAAELAKLETQANDKRQHRAVLEALEGYIQSASLEKLKPFIAVMPQLLEEVKQGTYSPDFIRAYIFEKLTGGTLKVLKCKPCDAQFSVDKPADAIGYHCPICGVSYGIIVDKDEVGILKAMLALTEPKSITYSTVVQIKPPSAKIPSESDTTGKPGSNAKGNK